MHITFGQNQIVRKLQPLFIHPYIYSNYDIKEMYFVTKFFKICVLETTISFSNSTYQHSTWHNPLPFKSIYFANNNTYIPPPCAANRAPYQTPYLLAMTPIPTQKTPSLNLPINLSTKYVGWHIEIYMVCTPPKPFTTPKRSWWLLWAQNGAHMCYYPLKPLGVGFWCFMIILKNIWRVKLDVELCLGLRLILCSWLEL